MIKGKMFPLLHWAGGKTQILDEIIKNMPTKYNNYYEPFIGGAAVLFAISPIRAYTSDINEQLVNLYIQVKESVENVIKKINILDSVPCTKEFYYYIRYQYNNKITNHILDAETAALMIWVNKHCFNGLYRVNKNGKFNVPYNFKIKGKSIDENNIRLISQYLNQYNIKISCLDFEKVCETVREGDFVYFDSPYVPESITASFTDYTMNGFSLKDHKRLNALFKRLDGIGAKIMLSNNDVPLVRELYAGYRICSLNVKRMINCNGNKRFGREVLIMNY